MSCGLFIAVLLVVGNGFFFSSQRHLEHQRGASWKDPTKLERSSCDSKERERGGGGNEEE